jgi:hypothetical protein
MKVSCKEYLCHSVVQAFIVDEDGATFEPEYLCEKHADERIDNLGESAANVWWL